MVRILHFSDLHLGAESYGRFDPDIGLSSRMGDFLVSLDQVVEYALGHDVQAVLFAGDAYKTCDPSPTHQREFARRIGQLARAGIQTVLLTGNHDVPVTRGRAHAVAIFETLEVENVHVLGKPGTLRLETRGGPVQVVALPWLGRSLLTTLDEYRNQTIGDIREAILERAENIVLGEIEKLDPAVPSVFMAHVSVFGASYGSERKTMLGHDLLLPASLYANPAFDYIALGHIHKHQVLHDSPPVVYSGSLERIDFGEEDEEKGFVVVEVEKGSAEFRFVPTAARKFVTIRIDAMSDDPMSDVAKAVSGYDIQDAVVRMIIHTTADLEPLLDDRACRQILKGAFFVAAIVRDVVRSDRLRFSRDGSVETLSPRELLSEYLKHRGVSSDRIQVVLDYADQLMAADPA